MKYNRLLQYQDKVFDKFLDSLFPLSCGDKDEDKKNKDSESDSKPIQSEDSDEETPLFI